MNFILCIHQLKHWLRSKRFYNKYLENCNFFEVLHELIESIWKGILGETPCRQFLKSNLMTLNYIWCSCNTLERPEGAVGVLQLFLPSHVLFPSALFRPFFKLQSSKLYILLWPIPLGSRNAFRRGYIYIAARTVWNAMCIGSPRGCGVNLTNPHDRAYLLDFSSFVYPDFHFDLI